MFSSFACCVTRGHHRQVQQEIMEVAGLGHGQGRGGGRDQVPGHPQLQRTRRGLFPGHPHGYVPVHLADQLQAITNTQEDGHQGGEQHQDPANRCCCCRCFDWLKGLRAKRHVQMQTAQQGIESQAAVNNGQGEIAGGEQRGLVPAGRARGHVDQVPTQQGVVLNNMPPAYVQGEAAGGEQHQDPANGGSASGHVQPVQTQGGGHQGEAADGEQDQDPANWDCCGLIPIISDWLGGAASVHDA